MATWNIRSIKGKERELEYEFGKAKLSILVVTETKKKGQGEMELDDGHVLLYSGVPEKERAAAGVGCLINKELVKNITGWKGWSERIMTVDLTLAKEEKLTIIAVYGPNEDERKETKDQFWEELEKVTEISKGNIFVAGDFNGRVGTKDKETTEVIGKYGEQKRNNNGERLIDYCTVQNMIIANTFYEHKQIHKYTRQAATREERSIIDYILVERSNRKLVNDVRVKRGAEIDSDHFLVVAKIKNLNKEQRKETCLKRKQEEKIKTYKLQKREVAESYEMIIKDRIQTEREKLGELDAERTWQRFKEIIIDAARVTCGVNRTNYQRNNTAWWNKDIKMEVELKKRRWKEYLGRRTDETYSRYKEQREKVKNIVQEAKKKSWSDFGDKMEENSKGNQKLFYRTLKTLRKGKTTTVHTVKNKKGDLLNDTNEVMERWREYFQELLSTQRRHTEEVILSEVNMDEEGNEEPITEEEIEEALLQLKNGKSPGHDKITSEMVKNMGEDGTRLLLEIFNKVWKEERIPKDWEIGRIVPIHKKGDNKECANYRGITLLSIPLKIYERILEKRLRMTLETTLLEVQSGFRKGRSVQDHVFTVKQIIKKTHEHNKKAYFAFVDLEKAFDMVPRQSVWRSLQQRGVDKKLIRAIESLYKNTTSYVIRNNQESRKFETKDGLRQGGVMSPALFTAFMDDIIRKCRPRIKKLDAGVRELKNVQISECAFADDVIVMANSERDLQRNMNIWNDTLKDFGMNMNYNKTKVMAIAREPQRIRIEVEGIILEQVTQFNYLGVIIDETGKQDIDLNERINKVNKLYYTMNKTFINKREVTKKTKMNVYKTIFRPILTYGSETWTLSNRMKKKLEATEMKYLRRVKGSTLMDKVRNTQIREELEIKPVTEFVEKRQLSWWGHLQRMDRDRPVRQVWEARMTGKRNRGRPKETWDDTVRKTLIEKGLSWAEGRTLAKDKKQWAKFIHGES